MLQENKKLLAVYAAWAFIHLSLWLTSGGDLFDPHMWQTRTFYPLAGRTPWTSGDKQSFNKDCYDYSELFVYLAAPLLIWYLYKTFKK
jgi:hypothetical protein